MHGDVLVVTLVPIEYGLPANYSGSKLREQRKYWRDRERNFPNAHDHVEGGCLVSLETEAEVCVCAHCLAAEAEWLRRHPHFQQ